MKDHASQFVPDAKEGAEGSLAARSVRLTPQQMRRICDCLCNDLDHADVIYARSNRLVIRYRRDTDTSVVAKFWARPDWRGAVRRSLQLDPSAHEWRNLRRFERAGVRVPKPLGICRVPRNPGHYTEALFLEDLGATTSATEHVKSLIRQGLEDELRSFEDKLIDMMGTLIGARLVDIDHGLINTVVVASGQPVRVDVELARRMWSKRVLRGAYGRMMGHLVATYTFAVQPDTQRATDFAQRLARRLAAPTQVLRLAGTYVLAMMDNQRVIWGIDTSIQLPPEWR